MNEQRHRLPRRLNLGCGRDHRDGWHNVDVNPVVDPDERVDLDETPWPWPSDHFCRIEARHVLEHLERVPWNELARILKPGGWFTLTYPIGHTRFEDATHRQFWGYHTAEQVGGKREHGHEIDVPFRLVDRDCDWQIGQSEPLVEWYVRYRLWRAGAGPWLEQIPGLFGEVTAVFEHEPDE